MLQKLQMCPNLRTKCDLEFPSLKRISDGKANPVADVNDGADQS